MYCTRKITNDIFWIGANDRRIALFESVYPVPRGVSYNSYIIKDTHSALLDTVDKSCGIDFFENVKHVMEGEQPEYLIVNHMEPDHCAMLQEAVQIFPDIKIVCTAKAAAMIKQFFDIDTEARCVTVKEGDTLSTGNHKLVFTMAPMVHWPEAMMTYDANSGALFSADAFGTFGAINGNLFADEIDFERDFLPEARRYYTNIVGKYGSSVQSVLKKASGLDIKYICPLHGPIWRQDFGKIIEKYDKWSSYTPEQTAVVIAYASVYGATRNAAEILAGLLAERGIKGIEVYDVSVTHPSYIVAEAFRASHLVLASTTYNAGIFVNMENLLHDLVAHNLQNRTVAIIENGSWAPASGKLMRETVSQMKNMRILENQPTIKSAVKQDSLTALEALAAELADDMLGNGKNAVAHCKHCGRVLPSPDAKCPTCSK